MAAFFSLIIQKMILYTIGFYRVAIRPCLGLSCRFHPSCSEYAKQAVTLWGPWRGGRMMIRRLLCCHPFHAGGHDPVPSKQKG